MGKLLRVLVVLVWLLTVGALVLGVLLFNRREMLKGRTQKLESTLKALGPTIEASEAERKPAEFPARDIDNCTAELIAQPQQSAFWKTYEVHREQQGLPFLEVNKRELQLMQFYKIDPITQKPQKDPATGLKVTSGEGTMQEVLDDVVAKSMAQLQRLNDTRQQLKTLREELVDTINELNKRKGELRQALNTIVERDKTIAQLEEKIKGLQQQIAGLEEEIKSLKDNIAELNQTITKKNEDIDVCSNVIRQLKQKLAEFEKAQNTTRTRDDAASSGGGGILEVSIQNGKKGRVRAVNPTWGFVVLELSDDFLRELCGKDLSAPPPPAVDMHIKRGPDEKYVTKVRLIQVRKDQKIGVADVLSDWLQMPVQPGDEVFY